MNRNILIAIIAVIVVTALGVGAYFLFFAKPAGITVAPTGSATLPSSGQVQQAPQGGAGTGGTTGAPGGTPVAISPRLVQISAGPVVLGQAVISRKAVDASSTPDVSISYIDRASGNVYSYLPRTRAVTRINNKTIPGIQSASWLPDGSFAFVRYLSGQDSSTINTYALAATSSNGFFLSQNLSDISVSSTSVLTLSSGVNGSSVSRGRIDGSGMTTVFTTPLSSIRASFAGRNQYLVFSKPSASLSGDAFLVSALGRFTHIAGPRAGLVALASPSGRWVLVSYTRGNTMQMDLVDTTTNVSLPLPVSSIADKCVWAANDASIYCGVPLSPATSALYPDDWYQGAVQFSDRIWKIDVLGRYAQLVLDFSTANKGELDATSLAIDPLSTTLTFINKNDSSLWSYSL